MTANERFSFWGGFACGAMAGMLGLSIAVRITIAHAFDVPSDYARQGYHQCDSPSGWCAKNEEPREDPCGGRNGGSTPP